MSILASCLLDVDDGSPACELAKHISEISEETSCATWEMGIEFELWPLVASPPSAEVARCMSVITLEDVSALKRLSSLAGGWVCWHDSDEPRESGVRFVPMAEWLDLYEREKGDERRRRG